MPADSHHKPQHGNPSGGAPAERTFIHRILRYVPNLLRDEWINIGVLLYDPNTGERRLRVIEDEAEFRRLRLLHSRMDEESLRSLRDHLESRFGVAVSSGRSEVPVEGPPRNGPGDAAIDGTSWLQVLEKWDATLSQSLQLADAKATTADDINTEVDRLYNERVALGYGYALARPTRPSAREQMRNYMDQVFRQAGIWNRIDKNVPVSAFTLDDDPMEIDYSYWRNDRKRGFVQTISLSTRADDAKMFAYTAMKIRAKASDAKIGISPEFAAVTDTGFRAESQNHGFLKKFLGDNDIAHVPLDNFAVWVAKLRPTLQ
jgi:hypothetical protein